MVNKRSNGTGLRDQESRKGLRSPLRSNCSRLTGRYGGRGPWGRHAAPKCLPLATGITSCECACGRAFNRKSLRLPHFILAAAHPCHSSIFGDVGANSGDCRSNRTRVIRHFLPVRFWQISDKMRLISLRQLLAKIGPPDIYQGQQMTQGGTENLAQTTMSRRCFGDPRQCKIPDIQFGCTQIFSHLLHQPELGEAMFGLPARGKINGR